MQTFNIDWNEWIFFSDEMEFWMRKWHDLIGNYIREERDYTSQSKNSRWENLDHNGTNVVYNTLMTLHPRHGRESQSHPGAAEPGLSHLHLLFIRSYWVSALESFNILPRLQRCCQNSDFMNTCPREERWLSKVFSRAEGGAHLAEGQLINRTQKGCIGASLKMSQLKIQLHCTQGGYSELRKVLPLTDNTPWREVDAFTEGLYGKLSQNHPGQIHESQDQEPTWRSSKLGMSAQEGKKHTHCRSRGRQGWCSMSVVTRKEGHWIQVYSWRHQENSKRLKKQTESRGKKKSSWDARNYAGWCQEVRAK